MGITDLSGIGPKKASYLKKMGIASKEDMLYFFPRAYEDRRFTTPINDLKVGDVALIKGCVVMIKKPVYNKRRQPTLSLIVEANQDQIEVVFFNGRFLLDKFKKGEEYFFYGKTTQNNNKIQMIHPDFNTVESSDLGIVPIYKLTKGISQKEMRKWQKTLKNYVNNIEEYIPEKTLLNNHLCSIRYALEKIHFPKGPDELEKAKHRLIFNELFLMQLGLLLMKGKVKKGIQFKKNNIEKEYIDKMPFKLTESQNKVVNEVISDMEATSGMNRLIQGDVGAGKTAIAEIALYKAVKNGYQGAFMAPTEILARQHYEGLKKSFGVFGINVGFLSGNMSVKEKKHILNDLKIGKVNIIIGTHAIIQKNVEFDRLGIVITDEQHRFGVNQRTLLSEKGECPDILVMTATPIPRTLAAIVYGGMDVSVIDQLPPSRKQIKTKAVTPKSRDKVYAFAKEEIDAGRQVYVVAPLIEDSKTLDIKSANEIYEELTIKFKSKNVALIHGDMKQSQKEVIMKKFYDGEYDILVATVVIEVGINVPNASLMIIENAERFGLAQLHQLRGRVGRGAEQSYCIIVTEGKSPMAIERAKTMTLSTDGFYISEKDLELRGPGEIFGTKQHGIPDMRLADLVKDIELVDVVKKEANKILDEDENLKKHKNLYEKIEKLYGRNISINL